jgi:RNA polymerase sigma-70 factor (ECF subfamily)
MTLAARHADNSDPDVSLMLQARDGSREAFNELALRYGPLLTRRFRHSPALRDIAEDLSQEVLLRIYRARTSYIPSAALRTWIDRIALNVARNAIRRRLRHPDEAAASMNCTRLRKAARKPSDDQQLPPLETLIQREQQRRAQRVLMRLKPRQRRAVQLVSLDGQSLSSAAKQMSLTTGALKSLLARARDSFRAEYRRATALKDRTVS